jgi:hypothetical protein
LKKLVSSVLVLAFLASVSHAGYLTSKEVAKIKTHWSAYVVAAEATDLPVEILPAIHYRESGLNLGWYSKKQKKVMPNVGGPFMLDKGAKNFIKGIRGYESEIWRMYGYAGPAPHVSDNFAFAALCAAHELKSKMRGKGLADAVWGYNGRSKMVTFKENAYLWNDPKRRPRMLAKYRHKGELVIYFDDRPGVMTIYAEIIRLRKEGKL